MRTLLWLLILFCVAVALAIAGRYNEAYALLVWPPYRMQISMNLLLLLLAGGFIGAYMATRLVARTLALPSAVRAWRKKRLKERAAQALREAERLFLEGRYGQALRQAEKAWEGGESQGLSALLAAKAAHHLREPERRQQWLDKALASDSETRHARLMVEAEFALADRRFDDAAHRLELLQASGPRHIAAIRLCLQAEQARGRWTEVERLTRKLRKYNALSDEQAAPLLRRAHLEQLRDAAGDLTSLSSLWQSLPEKDHTDPAFLLRAAPYLIEAGGHELAAQAITRTLNKSWESELALLYGRCQSQDLRAQLANAERWLKAHPADANLLLTLGRLCLRAELWGKAQSYFDASLSLAPSRSAHMELAHLAESLERLTEAHAHYRAAAEIG